ncbi:MAG: hypothetical protein ACYDD9_14370 [Acidithiobacillus sp.]
MVNAEDDALKDMSREEIRALAMKAMKMQAQKRQSAERYAQKMKALGYQKITFMVPADQVDAVKRTVASMLKHHIADGDTKGEVFKGVP